MGVAFYEMTKKIP